MYCKFLKLIYIFVSFLAFLLFTFNVVIDSYSVIAERQDGFSLLHACKDLKRELGVPKQR